MAILWILIGAALVVAISIFHVMNPVVQNISLYGYQIYGVPMWMLVTVPAAVGLLLGILMNLPARLRGAFSERRLSGRVRDHEKTNATLQQRITELERDLAIAQARTAEPPVIVQEVREVPVGTFSGTPLPSSTDIERAA